MEVSGFFSSSVLSNDDYKSQKKQNIQSPKKISQEQSSCVPDPAEMNRGIQELLKTHELQTQRKDREIKNIVKKPSKQPSKKEIYNKYQSFKQNILSLLADYDDFINQSVMSENGAEKSDFASESAKLAPPINAALVDKRNDSNEFHDSNSLETTVPSNTDKTLEAKRGISDDAAKNNSSKEMPTNISVIQRGEETSIKRVSPMNLMDTYIIFTDIKTSFKTTKYSDFLKINITYSSNTKKWYRKYFKYFYVVNGMLQFLDPDHKLPIEVLKDFEDLMIQKATTPVVNDEMAESEAIGAEKKEEKAPTPPLQQTNTNKFSHEMFLSGTNMLGYSIFMTSVKKEDFEDFITTLHKRIIVKYGPETIKADLKEDEISQEYEILVGSKRPEPLMSFQPYTAYNKNW
ncbi:hypothetical protein QEN19_001724 [Hanseniaspora menglaensis]